MGYQPRIKSPKGVIHGAKKSRREKGKDKKSILRRLGRSMHEEKKIATEREISGVTLKRLHTLGIQKFGSSPFSEHFDRWLTNVEIVLSEFEAHPNIKADEQFIRERTQAIATIKRQLDDIRRKETALDQELMNLSGRRNHLKLINKEYVTRTEGINRQRNSEIKRLYYTINRLKKDQDKVIRMKTGFFRGISRKDREHKEIAITQEINEKQTELELIILDFNAQQKKLQAEYERKREPVLEQIKTFNKTILIMETDGSLEERWFACEALIDSVNTFLQRKATLPQ